MILIKNVKNYNPYRCLCRSFVQNFEKFNKSSLLLAQNVKDLSSFLIEMTLFSG